MSTPHNPPSSDSSRRFMVVDKNRTPIFTNMHSQANAQDEADRLNREGLAEFAPYRVTRDTVAENLGE